MKIDELNQRVSAARRETEARGETFYPEPSRIHLRHGKMPTYLSLSESYENHRIAY